MIQNDDVTISTTWACVCDQAVTGRDDFFAQVRGNIHAGVHLFQARIGVDAMTKHPELVAGEGRACTELMRAMDGKVALKTGAEAVFSAIIPEERLSVAVKITDGASRASEAAVAAILVKLGVLDPDHTATLKRMTPTVTNWRGLEVGHIRPTAALR